MGRIAVSIVDDHRRVLDSIVQLLGVSDFDVAKFRSAGAFLKYLDDVGVESIDCLVLDVRLPGMNGIELLEELRRSNTVLPTVLISGHATRDIAELGLKSGASALLEKPFEGRELIREIHQAMENAKRSSH